jgi:hypothetical protein
MKKLLLVLAGLVWLNAAYAQVVIANDVPWQKMSKNTWGRHVDSNVGRTLFLIKLSNKVPTLTVITPCPNSRRHEVFAWTENQTFSQGINCEGKAERRSVIVWEPWFTPYPEEVLEKIGGARAKIIS